MRKWIPSRWRLSSGFLARNLLRQFVKANQAESGDLHTHEIMKTNVGKFINKLVCDRAKEAEEMRSDSREGRNEICNFLSLGRLHVRVA